MGWNKKLDDELKKLLFLGKNYNEIAKTLNLSEKCVANRTFRIGFKILKSHREDILCKNCGKIINKTLSDEKKFCNRSCSGQYNNKGRKHSEETKNKIRIKNLGKTYPNRIRKEKIVTENKKIRIKRPYTKNSCEINNDKTKKIIQYKEIKLRKCRYCKEDKLMLKYKIICEECGIKYYKHYRPQCEFDFKISKHKEEFDLSLVNEYGWYSPTNKGNNLNGVSRDHTYSVKDGFINKIDPSIIKHPANCKLMRHIDNNKKKTTSLITLDDLLMKIKMWNEKYSFG